MLVIHGEADGSDEYVAAEKLAQSASAMFPDIERSPQLILELFPSIQCFGQKVQDIDLLVFFADYRDPDSLYVARYGSVMHSFCAVIEVKLHRPDAVSFEGAKCSVLYHGKYHDVTGQSERQKYSLTEYIKRNHRGRKSPWVTNLIWLYQVPNSKLPKVDSNIIGAESGWKDVMDKISLMSGAGKTKTVETFSKRTWMRSISEVFSRRLEASNIDRAKLEAITKTVLDRSRQQYADKLGKQLLIYRGRGGTGKTIQLIRIAYQAYDELGLRVILLTYNKALVADLRRLLTLLGIRDAVGQGSIAVKTIHSFMREWLLALGVMSKRSTGFLQRYEDSKQEALNMLSEGAIENNDIDDAKSKESRDLAWDLVMIDESQDWPESERDLIYMLYGHKQVVIADGVDQFVRGVEKIDWREGVNKSESQIVSLRKSLRLKASLCRTVGHYAEQIEYANWNLQPLEEAHGGRVIVLVGDALNYDFHQKLSDASKKDGNRPIDTLICIPPSWVDVYESRRCSRVASRFLEWGWDVWDAVDPELRGDYPTSLDQYRIVQYESCRGLEGWVVVNIALDEFFDYKMEAAEFSEAEQSDLYFDRDFAATEYAKKWTMIPLTRAIDTLVLHVTDPDSYIGHVLKGLKEKYPDDIEWVELG